MMDIERVLALVVRDRIRAALAPMPAEHIQIEMDETLPAIAGERMISVIPGGIEAGPYTTGMNDLSPRIRVFAVWRIRAVPRDRKREVYLSNYTGLSSMLDAIYRAIHNQNIQPDIDTVAQSLQIGGIIKGCRLVEPLRFINLESQAKMVYPADFGSNESQPAAMGRTITFGRARYLAAV
jgi:hypothetical protein